MGTGNDMALAVTIPNGMWIWRTLPGIPPHKPVLMQIYCGVIQICILKVSNERQLSHKPFWPRNGWEIFRILTNSVNVTKRKNKSSGSGGKPVLAHSGYPYFWPTQLMMLTFSSCRACVQAMVTPFRVTLCFAFGSPVRQQQRQHRIWIQKTYIFCSVFVVRFRFHN